jgi:hypothetical protein
MDYKIIVVDTQEETKFIEYNGDESVLQSIDNEFGTKIKFFSEKFATANSVLNVNCYCNSNEYEMSLPQINMSNVNSFATLLAGKIIKGKINGSVPVFQVVVQSKKQLQ